MEVGLAQVAGGAYRLYQAAFDRQPDTPGLAYWVGRMDGGMGLQDVAQSFAQSSEFQLLYGVRPTNGSLINAYYLNVLGRLPEQSGYSYWRNEMVTGLSASGMLASFSESQEDHINISGLLDKGVWLG